MKDKNNTIEIVKLTNLCISCGICKGVCPKSCIKYELSNGMYLPVVDEVECINCGLCKKSCPSINNSYEKTSGVIDAMTGKYISAYNGWCKNEEIRHFSASSGVVTTIIQSLLNNDLYDVAFSLDTFAYDKQLVTNQKDKNDYNNPVNNNLPKSRYLPVSHERAIEFIKANLDKRVILVGTSCAVQGINNVINNFKLNRDNYLLIGLFCDKVFNYNINEYFKDNFSDGKELTSFHFKNKDSGGWPGNMKLMFSNGDYKFVSNQERGKVKMVFMPERCLYCIDKVNVSADVSIGDNYTNFNYSEKGSNSIIVRTQRGKNAFDSVNDKLELFDITMDDVVKAQVFEERAKNALYAIIKEKSIEKEFGESISLNNDILCGEKEDVSLEYQSNQERIKLGLNYKENPQAVFDYIEKLEKDKKKAEAKYALRSFLGGIKKKILK